MAHKILTLGALQLPTLGQNTTTLAFYFKRAHERGVTLMLFGEYVVSDFFKNLESQKPKEIQAQVKAHLVTLKAFAKEYDMTLIVPIVVVKKGKLYKQIAKVTAKRTEYYMQQILIPYPHWNEEKFFDNPVEALRQPLTFNHKGFKVMVMAGFELHFEHFWALAQQKKVDVVLLPTSSTFASHERWKNIITSKAFMYGCYVLRANRLGEFEQKGIKWRFYGDSMLVSPDGKVEMMLEDKESMLIEEIEKSDIKKLRKLWGFERALKVRGAM